MARFARSHAATATLIGLTVFAGCLAPPAPMPDAQSFAVSLSGVPTTVRPGETFTIQVGVSGEPASTTDHIGAHWGFNSTDEPTTTVYDNACVHKPGPLPADYSITCSIATIGKVYLRGHARIAVGGATYNYWSDEAVIFVEPATTPSFTLTATAPATQVQVGQAINFTLQIEGPAAYSDHIGGHFGPNSTNEPSVGKYPGICVHVVGRTPGSFHVTCTPTQPGTYYVRGHLRVTASTAWNYFAQEYSFTAS